MKNDLFTGSLERSLRAGIGRPFRFLQEVGSTNTEAMAWAREGAPDGAMVVTDHQTAGRGRWSRSWTSTPGALLQFSLVLRPRLGLDEMGLLTTALGVACAEGIERATGLPATIKWPNDVRIGGKKVAGMLVESHLVGSALDAAVAGIGINVGWTSEEIPQELRRGATSIAAELRDQPPGRPAILAAILEALDPRYRGLPASGPKVLEEAASRSDVLGTEVKVRFSDGREVEGLAKGLTDGGALEVTTPDGTTIVSVAEVEQLRPREGRR